MEEELDHRGVREPVALREADGVDADELVVVRGSDECVERLEQIAGVRNRSGELLELLRQERFVHNRHGSALRDRVEIQRGCGTILM